MVRPIKKDEFDVPIVNDTFDKLRWVLEKFGLPTVLVLAMGWVLVVYLLTPQGKLIEGQQAIIMNLSNQTQSNKEALIKLTEVVSELNNRQRDSDLIVKGNQILIKQLSESELNNSRLNEVQIQNITELQKVVVDIAKTMSDARIMMKDVPAQREEANKLLREMRDEMKKEDKK
jgi:hypothetical protein